MTITDATTMVVASVVAAVHAVGDLDWGDMMPVPVGDARVFLVGLLFSRLGPPKTRYKDAAKLDDIIPERTHIVRLVTAINDAKWHNVKLTIPSVLNCTTIGDLVKLIASKAK